MLAYVILTFSYSLYLCVCVCVGTVWHLFLQMCMHMPVCVRKSDHVLNFLTVCNTGYGPVIDGDNFFVSLIFMHHRKLLKRGAFCLGITPTVCVLCAFTHFPQCSGQIPIRTQLKCNWFYISSDVLFPHF